MESLASKYRPKVFADVVGQDNIKQILQNQIRQNSIKQAYLFTGGAGTGKTTTARIFGREINQGKGELIEIDAASNNGVDNVRELRESVKFKPLDAPYKVYIIDEVHMLSTGAFNALLKTLEEPPAHAVFILCTTDPQKIPATILSRVQRFDFKRMTVDQLKERLSHILSEERKEWGMGGPEFAVSDSALDYIAKLANGGMRDAISLLDTCLGYKDDIELSDVFEILGTTDYDSYCSLLKDIELQDVTAIFNRVERAHENGKDLKQMLKGLLEFVVELQKAHILGFQVTKLPTSCQESVEDLFFVLGSRVESQLSEWFRGINDIYNRVKYESHPKLLIEGELILLCK